jgi:hypothetical protein
MSQLIMGAMTVAPIQSNTQAAIAPKKPAAHAFPAIAEASQQTLFIQFS